MALPKFLALTIAIAALFLVTLPTPAANTIVTPIKIPNSGETLPYNINDNGDVVGFYYPPASIDENTGFLLHNGQINSFKYPGAQFTEPHYLANDGDIYGLFRTTPTDSKYFLLHDNAFAEIDSAAYNAVVNVSQDFSATKFPGADSTGISAANARGDVVGFFIPHNEIQPHGFIYTGGQYIALDNTEMIWGINNSGQMIGASLLAPEVGATITFVPEPSIMVLLVAGFLPLDARRPSQAKISNLKPAI